jgi:hypothetical protein
LECAKFKGFGKFPALKWKKYYRVLALLPRLKLIKRKSDCKLLETLSASGFHGYGFTIVGICCENPAGTE